MVVPHCLWPFVRSIDADGYLRVVGWVVAFRVWCGLVVLDLRLVLGWL